MSYPSTKSLDTYYYGSQIRQYIIQFMAVFSGLQIQIGENDRADQTKLVDVPVRYGSSDRVVAAIKSSNTTNKPIRLPTMAAYLTGIQMAPEHRKGVGVTNRYSHLERGGAFPRDIRVIEKQMPVPYMANFELTIMASNSDQHFQMLEQILMLFDPILQIQTSDDVHDWKRITMVELTGVGLEENYPMGTDSRVIQTTLTFSTLIHLAPPTNFKKNVLHKIKVRLDLVGSDDSLEDIISDVGRELPAYETLVDGLEVDYPDFT